jgi:hypothetical protein
LFYKISFKKNPNHVSHLNGENGTFSTTVFQVEKSAENLDVAV